jgi:hypothetical protein
MAPSWPGREPAHHSPFTDDGKLGGIATLRFEHEAAESGIPAAITDGEPGDFASK